MKKVVLTKWSNKCTIDKKYISNIITCGILQTGNTSAFSDGQEYEDNHSKYFNYDVNA